MLTLFTVAMCPAKTKKMQLNFLLNCFPLLHFFFYAAPPKVFISNYKARKNILLVCKTTILIRTSHTIQILSSQVSPSGWH